MARKDKGYKDTFESLVEPEAVEIVNEKGMMEATPSHPVAGDSDLKKELLEEKKQSFDDMYKRKTFPLDNELYKRLEKHFEGKGRGYQTKFAKYAITKALDELEGK